MFRPLVLAIGFGITSACTLAPSPFVAQPPKVETSAKPSVGGNFELELADVTDDKRCAHDPKFNDYCVTHLRTAMDGGLRSVLRRFIDPAQPGETYAASFRLLELSQTPTYFGDGDFEQPKIVLRWRFDLTNASGEKFVTQTASTSQTYRDPRKADDALQGLLKDAMEKIAEALSTTEWKKSKPERLAPPVPAQGPADGGAVDASRAEPADAAGGGPADADVTSRTTGPG
jgi:hypothetical protein